MAVKVTIAWENKNPNTIYNRLAEKLGREPTRDEVKAEVSRILRAAKVDRDWSKITS